MQCILLVHNIRSTYNVGAILRTADGFGVEKVICSGYSPYPTLIQDTRLPHIRDKLTKQIHKSALGAEQSMICEYTPTLPDKLLQLRQQGYTIVALEQTADAIPLTAYQPPKKIALLLGEEVHGIEASLVTLCDTAIEIPMHGHKESFNVSVAAGIALFGLYYPRV